MNYRALGAVEAIHPAVHRWEQLLWKNFRLGRLIKLSLAALLAEIAGVGLNLRGPIQSDSRQLGQFLPPAFIAFLVMFAVVGFALALVVFYLSCRMKFAVFEATATGNPMLGGPWRRYGRQTWRLIWTTVLVWVCMIVPLMIVAGVFTFFAIRNHIFENVQMHLGRVVEFIAIAGIVVAVWAILLAMVMVLLRDFMVPVWALESLGIQHAWERAKQIAFQDDWKFVQYLLMKLAIHVGAGVLALIATACAALAAAVPCAIAWFAGRAIWMQGGMGARFALGAIGVALLIAAIVWVIGFYLVAVGSVLLLADCYAVCWVGSRYQPLGNLIWPPAPPVVPPPVTPNPEGLPPGGGSGAPPVGGQDDWLTAMG